MKSNSHFWPAYVDMMTVLLLVYLLITLLFQILMIIAQQNVGIKLRERNQLVTNVYKYDQGVNPNELRLDFQGPKNRNFLTEANKEKLIQWIDANKDQIEEKGAVIFATSSDDAQVGFSLSLQYQRSLEVFSILQSRKVSVQKVKIENASVNRSDIGFVSIRILRDDEVNVVENQPSEIQSQRMMQN